MTHRLVLSIGTTLLQYVESSNSTGDDYYKYEFIRIVLASCVCSPLLHVMILRRSHECAAAAVVLPILFALLSEQTLSAHMPSSVCSCKAQGRSGFLPSSADGF